MTPKTRLFGNQSSVFFIQVERLCLWGKKERFSQGWCICRTLGLEAGSSSASGTSPALFLYSPWQEIPLSEILQVRPAQDLSSLPPGSNPHCFEVITANVVYFVGEDNGSPHHCPALVSSGVGLNVGRSWEKAISQAMMPVTPKASVCSGRGQGNDHSEYQPKPTQRAHSGLTWINFMWIMI